jgi:hypothetical protein
MMLKTNLKCNIMKTKRKRLWTTGIAALFLVMFLGGCKDDNVEVVGVCPAVLSTIPINGAVNVPLGQVISATFNEPMNPVTFTQASFTVEGVSLKKVNPETSIKASSQRATSVVGTVSCVGAVATFTPTSPLVANTSYTARIYATVKDLMGNALQVDHIWVFSTGATIVPTIIATDPLDLATNVPLNKVVSATFSQPMLLSSLTSSFTLKEGIGLTTVAGAVSIVGSTAYFTPDANLLSDSTYTVTITTGATNATGTPIPKDSTWTFSTGSIIAPTVIATDPVDLATGVALNKVISADFSEAMLLSSLTTSFTLKEGIGLTTVAGAVSIIGTTAYFTPDVDLLSDSTYTATITTGATNLAGTPIVKDTTWTFTTIVSAPKVITTDPVNLATDVALDKVISADFSEAMLLSSLTTSFTLKEGVGLTTVAGAVSIIGTTAYFTPDVDLLSNETYTATITTGATNLAGTPIAKDTTWTFTTIASVPKVITTDPVNLATGVALDKVISADFSEAMLLSSLTTSFTLKEGVGLTTVAGAVSIIGTTAYFTPDANLLSDSTYTATITTGATNPSGTPIAKDTTWTFSTVAHKGPIAPDLLSVARFGIIAGVGVTNAAGASEIHDMDVGIYPGVRTSITGFMDVDGGPGLIFNGAFYASDDIAPPGVAAMLLQAKNDLVAAYLYAEGATAPAPAIVAGDQGGTTLYPGIYKSTSTLLIQSGDLTLDAQGDANAVWIFQIASDFTTVGGSPYPSPAGGNVILSGGAQAKNVYWQVGSSAIIGDYTSFKGNILALTSITMNAYSRAQGRMLTQNAAVTLTSTNIITKP